MAVKDTHKAFERLTGAGYSKEMSEALLELLSESWDDLATKTDLVEVKADLKSDLKALEKETKSDLKALEAAFKSDMREVELRMRLHLYAVAIVVIGVLAALELIPR